jgi:hypothetical protein
MQNYSDLNLHSLDSGKAIYNEQVKKYNQYLNELRHQRQYYNQQLNWLECSGGGIKPEQPVQDVGFLLQEDGFDILQEDNNKIIIT